MLNRNRKLTLLAVSVASVLAMAQAGAAEQQQQLEEIVVTARQRAEKLEDVPVTVQAFTATEIKSAGIERPQDFIGLTPGVSQVQTAEAGDLQLSIRGINTGRDAETNFALVIDGVLQTNPQALNQELSGLTQVEVLKGPQGALYGRNAVAGAIIMTTRQPGDSFEADVSAGYGNYNSYKANLWVGGPIGDTAKAAFGAYTRNTDGQWTNSYLGCNDCVDYFEENGANGRLLFDLGDSGTLDMKAKYSKIKSGAINFNASLALKEAAKIFGAPLFQEDPNDHAFAYINNVRPENEQKNINVSIKGDWKLDIGTLTGVLAYNDQTNYFLTDGTSAAFFLYSATTTCNASNNAKPGNPLPPPFGPYQTSSGFVQTFFPPYSPALCDGYQYQQRDQKDASLELRLNSPGDQAFRWTAGVYFADIKRQVVVAQGSDNAKGLLAQPFVPTSGPNPTDLLYDDDFTSKVYAGFGQLAYDLAPGLEVAVALRYDREQRDVDNNVPTCSSSTATSGPCRAQTPFFSAAWNSPNNVYTSPYINPAYTATPSYAASGIPSRSKTFSQMQPKLSINWKINDEWALYTSYGYGFRSGGFNSTGSAATIAQWYQGKNGGFTPLCLGASTPWNWGTATNPVMLPLGPPTCTANSTYTISDVNDDYKKEVSKAFEAGFKANLFDHRLSVNGAIYQTNVDDMQFFNFFAGPFGLLRVVTNIDQVKVKGYELDFRWKASEYFSFFGGYGHTGGQIDKYTGRPYTVGNRIPYAPDYTGNLGAELTIPMGSSSMDFFARVDGEFVGETWFHPVQDELLPNLFTALAGYGQGNFEKMKRDPYQTVNARAGVRGENWSVTAWGRNLADKEFLAEIISAPEFGGAFVHDAKGRSYGLEVSYAFK